MLSSHAALCLLALLSVASANLSFAEESDSNIFDLRYKFTKGEELRTSVLQQVRIRTRIEGTTETAGIVTKSIKNWKVTDVDDKGNITFVHSVEHVDMKNEVTGREAVHYDSRDSKEPPAGYKHVSRRVGVPLTRVIMTNQGKVLTRLELAPADGSSPGQIVLPLPKKPVIIGALWLNPYDIPVKLQSGTQKVIKARQRFELKSVKDDVALIKVTTQILSPVDNPEIKAQLIQEESDGTIRFDIAAGRMLRQQIDLDRRVVGHPNPKSSMHYRTRFTESLVTKDDRTVQKPKKPSATKKK